MTASASDEIIPSWEHLDTRFVADGVPGLVVVRERPAVTLFVDAQARGFGAYVETDDPPAMPQLTTVRCREIFIEGRRHLELSVAERALFRTFYLLLSELVTRIVVDRQAFGAAAAETLSHWRSLLQQAAALSDERQSGLFGELWLLERLIRARGPTAVGAWTGPLRAAHDFRLAGGDVEVKTTYGERRVHVVNGLAQLTPVDGVPLHLLSLRLQAAGEGGRTLPEAIEAIEAHLEQAPAESDRFRLALERAGYRTEDRALYPATRRLAAPAVLVPVEDGCPRLTLDALNALPPGFAPGRVRDVSYRIDVEGLGWSDGAPAFLELIPETDAAASSGTV